MGKTNFDEIQLDDSKLYDGSGKQILAAQQTLTAITAYTATSSGGTTVTSTNATDLDTTSAALKTLRDEVAAMRVVLAAHGLIA